MFSLRLSSQDVKPVNQLSKSHSNFMTDRLGNVYLINPYRLTMYNKEGDSLREFNSRKYGEISYVDATDPYQVLVFFKDYNLVLFLDNFLSENGPPIDLQELGYDQVSFACQSREKGLWIFDLVRQRIIKLNSEFKMSNESINLAQWFGMGVEPILMLEYNNQLFVQTSAGNILIFDHFATFIKQLGISTKKELQVLDNQVLYLKDNKYCEFNLSTLDENCKALPFNHTQHLRKEKGRLYSSNEKRLAIYSIK